MRDDFENEIYGNRHLDYDDVQRIVSKKLVGSLAWMVFGLVISGIVGYFVMTNEGLQMTVYSMFTPLMFLELAVVFIFSNVPIFSKIELASIVASVCSFE